jgi:hypothetical protein
MWSNREFRKRQLLIDGLPDNAVKKQYRRLGIVGVTASLVQIIVAACYLVQIICLG